MKKPLLSDYDIKTLCVLGNNEYDIEKRELIKSIIVNKILEFHFNLFILSNKFLVSNGILQECLADAIVIEMTNEFYCMNDVIMSKVVSSASLDVIGYYGNSSKYQKFKDVCQVEFWSRADAIENKNELNYKRLKKVNI